MRPFGILDSDLKNKGVYSLKACTAFVGRNRSGKTACLDAIRLALTGKHKAGHLGSHLIELAANPELGLNITLSGEDGSACFAVPVSSRKARTPIHALTGGLSALTADQRDHILPTEAMHALVELGPDKGRRAIFHRFGELKELPAPTGLSEGQTKLWRESVEVMKNQSPHADVAELLTLLNEFFDRLKNEKGRRHGQKSRELEERKQAFGGAMLGSEQIEMLEKRTVLAKAWESASALRRRKAELGARRSTLILPGAVDDLASEVARLEREVAELQAEQQKWIDEERECDRKLVRGAAYLDALDIAISLADETGESPCLLCGYPHFEPGAAKEQIEPRVADRRSKLAAAKEALSSAGRARSAKESLLFQRRVALSFAQAARTNVEQALMNVDLQVSEVDKALAVVKAPASYEGPTAEVISAQLLSLRQAEAIRAELARDTAWIEQVARERDDAKECEVSSKRLLEAALEKAQATAEAAVNAHIVEGFRAQLDLTKCAWNVYGVDGRPHNRHTMCGAELGALLIALSVAWTDGSPLRVLVLDDADIASFDPVNMKLFLTAVQRAVSDGLLTQAFVGWSRAEEIPEGWHVIVTDEAAPAVAAAALPPPVVLAVPPRQKTNSTLDVLLSPPAQSPVPIDPLPLSLLVRHDDDAPPPVMFPDFDEPEDSGAAGVFHGL